MLSNNGDNYKEYALDFSCSAADKQGCARLRPFVKARAGRTHMAMLWQ